MKILMKDLSFAPRSGMGILQKLMPNKILWEIVKRFKDEDKKVRAITLPSAHDLKKSIAYFFGEKVSRGEMTWEEVVKIWRGKLKLKDGGLSMKEMKRLHAQRAKEILKEKQ